MQPGNTHLGQPLQILRLGKTELPFDVIMDYLESMKDVFTVEVCGAYFLSLWRLLTFVRHMIYGPIIAITSPMILLPFLLEKAFQVISPTFQTLF